MNKYILSGEVGEESFADFCVAIENFEATPDEPVEMVLNSIGGTALDALAFCSRMRLSPCDINVTVFGIAGSAAVLLLAAGDYRRMTKESWLMVHEDIHSARNTSTSKLEQESRNARLMEDHWSALLEELTGTKKEVWLDLHKNGDLYLTPKECVQLGIVDEII